MITLDLNSDGFTGNILIEPNRPIEWSDNVRFIKYLALISIIIAAFFVYHGFLLVLPFSGIEVIWVSVCLYLVFKHYSTCQVLHFTKDSVILESGKTSASQRIEYQRYWSTFYVDCDGQYNIPRLSISSKGKTTEIGYFLNFDDKSKLINIITNMTDCFHEQTSPNIKPLTFD